LIPGLEIENLNLTLVVLVIFSAGLLVSRNRKGDFYRFFNGPLLIFSLIASIMLQKEFQAQRLVPFFPIMLLALSYILEAGLRRRFIATLGIVFVLLFYMFNIGNFVGIAKNSDSKHQLRKSVIEKILSVTNVEDWRSGENSLVVYSPEDLPNLVYNYHGHPYYYLLYEATDSLAEFTKDGNEIVWEKMNFPESNSVYLICDGFGFELNRELCLDYFLGKNSDHSVVDEILIDESVLIYEIERKR